MATINPYLNFNGNTEEAFNFYKSVFGGEFIALMRWKDAPEADKILEGDREKIMHVSLPIGKGNILMATDACESMGQTLTAGNNFYICIGAESKEEAEKLFNGLSAGGKIEMPLQDMFWGAYFGMFTDKFGIQWMVSYDYNQQK
ncbi:MAG: VOC family protein [Thermodesulfobacteriota bacterium]